jgi:hypothetical protein
VVVIATIAMWGFYEFDNPPKRIGGRDAGSEFGIGTFCKYLWFTVSTFVLRFPLASDSLPWQLEFARVAGPLTLGLGGLIALVHDLSWRLSNFSVFWCRSHTIICGASRATVLLATRLRARGGRVIFVDDRPKIDVMQELRSNRFRLIAGAVDDVRTWRFARAARATQIVVQAPTDAMSMGAAAHIASRRHGGDSPVRVFIDDLRLYEKLAFDQGWLQCHAPTRLSFQQHEQIAARVLLHEQPLDATATDSQGIRPGDATRVHLIVLGEGDFAAALVLQAARIGHFANGTSVCVHLVGSQADELDESLRLIAPGVHQACTIQVHARTDDNPLSWTELWSSIGSGPASVIMAVCGPLDERNLAAALSTPQLPEHVHLRVLSQQSLDAELLGQCLPAHVLLACVASLSMRPEIVFDDEIDSSARRIHEAYLATIPSPDPSRESHRPWTQLPAAWRHANRSQADHVQVKLRALGFCLQAGQGAGESLDMSPSEVEALAECEHRRWMADRLIAGWRYHPTRNDRDKMHPDLQQWSDLDESARDKDRNAVRNIAEIVKAMNGSIRRVVKP